MRFVVIFPAPTTSRTNFSKERSVLLIQVAPLAGWPGERLVEAAGQLFHLFRDGLDYAFILLARGASRSGACYPNRFAIRILVPAPRSAGL